jgi:hypothetical protein
MRRYLFPAAVAVLLGCLLWQAGPSALASEEPAAETALALEEDSLYINPLYGSEAPELVLDGASETEVDPPQEADYLATYEEAGAVLRSGMEARQETVTVMLKAEESTAKTVYTAIFSQATAHTGVPTQGDYLLYHYYSYRVHSTKITYQGSYYYTFVYTLTYLDTAQEEDAVAAAAQAVCQGLQPEDDSDYALVKAVYAYVTENVTYDTEHDSTYQPMYSAYAAAVTGTAVCQGYASYLYRLLLTLGVDCRCVTGNVSGGLHAWNIVKIDGYYYNVDATWDAGKETWQWFLKSDLTFSLDHGWKDESLSASYPISELDYDDRVSGLVPLYNMIGDTNGDGAVTLEDVAVLFRYVTGQEQKISSRTAADVTGDGIIDLKDVTRLAQYVDGQIDTL